MINLSNKIALVTAGSRGLGAGICKTLAAQGADVAFTYIQNEEAAQAVAEAITQMGRRALAIKADAGDFDLAFKVIEQVQSELGALDMLVCNAGYARGMALHKMSEADWDDVMRGSLKSAFNYIRAASPPFMERNAGKIVCIGSINGLRGRIGSTAYNAAKAGLMGLCKTAAAELGRYNVNVNLIAPGFIESDSQKNTPELIRNLVLNENAIKRLGTPEDIAGVVAFLCSEDARHVTGQVIKVDAGQYL